MIQWKRNIKGNKEKMIGARSESHVYLCPYILSIYVIMLKSLLLRMSQMSLILPKSKSLVENIPWITNEFWMSESSTKFTL